MTPAELLVELEARGVAVMVTEPDRLRITAPAGALDDAMRRAIAAKKPALLQLLRTSATGTPEDRRAWSDELLRDLHRWLSVHPPDVWTAARIGERIAPQWKRLDTLLTDYEMHGEDGDRKAAVFAANAVAQVAARAAREWTERNRR